METHGGIQSFFIFLLWKVWNTLPNNEELQKLLNVAAHDAAKLQQVLSDKEAANKLLNSPQAQVLLKKFLGK